MKRRRSLAAAAALALALVAPGCFTPQGFPLSAKTAYGTPVLNGYALFYDLSVLCEIPFLAGPLAAINEAGLDSEATWQAFAIIAMPLAFVGSIVGGTLSLPVTLLLFGGKPADWQWHWDWHWGSSSESSTSPSPNRGSVGASALPEDQPRSR